MKTEDIRNIFSRFQNLNLLFLMEDLRRWQVASGKWFDPKTKHICPVAHGWVGQHSTESMYEDLCDLAGVAPKAAVKFIEQWDCDYISNAQLMEVLESILAERLADALAVQQLIHGAPDDQPLPSSTVAAALTEAV